jgi:hypothetical protein
LAEKYLAKDCDLMHVLPYPLAVGFHALDSLSLSGELVHLAANVGWYVVTMPKGRYQAARGRLDVLRAQVLIV